MKNIVVFNALQTSLSGGIGRYSYELAQALYKYIPNDIKIVIREDDRELFSNVKDTSLIIAENIKNSKDRNKYEQFVLPKYIAKKYPNAIIHYPDTMAPLLAKNKVVITVHDLAFKSLKDVFTLKTRVWKNFVTDRSIKKANKIISITEFTFEELKKHYGNSVDGKCNVILNGFNDFSSEKIVESNIRHNINYICKNEKYVLTVSTISPRKNVDGLIKAFAKLEREDIKLVVAGARGWMFDSVFNLVKEMNLQEMVIFTDKINDDELKMLYKNCEAFVYPSFYEGFGLPPLEAMSYGKPVAVSNAASLPEVVGDSALLFDPNSIDGMYEKIKTLLIDEEVVNKLTKKSSERLNKFSWDKCAKEVYEVYKSIDN